MPSEQIAAYINDPLYQKALRKLQTGDWGPGLWDLNQLKDHYPDSEQLKNLCHEMELRARIDKYEAIDNRKDKKRKNIKWGLRLTVLILIAGFVYWGGTSYSLWIQQQMASARQKVGEEVQLLELTAKYRDGQRLLDAGQGELALQLFNEISAEKPDLAGLSASIEKANRLIDLEDRYNQAMNLMNLNERDAALQLLEEINREEPFFKDVSIRIAEINNQMLLGDLLSQAETAYGSNNWEEAAAKYETIRSINPDYRDDTIEDHLFTSYIHSAENALNAQSDSFDNLEVAENYFRKALALRPQDKSAEAERNRLRNQFKESLAKTYVRNAQEELSKQSDSLEALAIAEDYFSKALDLLPGDPEIKLQQSLAFRYLKAQDDFTQGKLDAVISSLEEINGVDPEYAAGTSRQTLYEAYIARGEGLLASGAFELALTDFQRAATLAAEMADPQLPLYTAQIKVAYTQGALGDYESAVSIYQEAVDSFDLNQTSLQDAPDIRDKLNQADRYVNLRYYKYAYRVYQEVAPTLPQIVNSVTYTVQSGDYLPMLANHYGTTLEAIALANNLGTSKQIKIGQELIIPHQK